MFWYLRLLYRRGMKETRKKNSATVQVYERGALALENQTFEENFCSYLTGGGSGRGKPGFWTSGQSVQKSAEIVLGERC